MVDTGCVEFGIGIVSWDDKIDEVVVAKELKGVTCVSSADDTLLDKINDLPTPLLEPTDLLLGDSTLFHLETVTSETSVASALGWSAGVVENLTESTPRDPS